MIPRSQLFWQTTSPPRLKSRRPARHCIHPKSQLLQWSSPLSSFRQYLPWEAPLRPPSATRLSKAAASACFSCTKLAMTSTKHPEHGGYSHPRRTSLKHHCRREPPISTRLSAQPGRQPPPQVTQRRRAAPKQNPSRSYRIRTAFSGKIAVTRSFCAVLVNAGGSHALFRFGTAVS
jgi:hypothetical protein